MYEVYFTYHSTNTGASRIRARATVDGVRYSITLPIRHELTRRHLRELATERLAARVSFRLQMLVTTHGESFQVWFGGARPFSDDRTVRYFYFTAK